MNAGRPSGNNAKHSLRSGHAGLSSLIIVVLLATLLGGCRKATVFGYETKIWPLDGKSELHISTGPSGFAKNVSQVPFLWKEVRSPNSVYFTVFVRQVGQMGPNPHIESILIHSFSYSFPGQEPVQLISDYPGNYWQQGNPKDNPNGSGPVPVHEGWYMELEIDLTLNGERFLLEGITDATKREYVRPLITEIFR